MRQTAGKEGAARAEAPTAGSLRNSTTAQATRTARVTRGGRERVGGGELVRLLGRTQGTGNAMRAGGASWCTVAQRSRAKGRAVDGRDTP